MGVARHPYLREGQQLGPLASSLGDQRNRLFNSCVGIEPTGLSLHSGGDKRLWGRHGQLLRQQRPALIAQADSIPLMIKK